MVIHNVFLFLLVIYVAKCDVDFGKMCKNDYRTMNDIQIDVSKYCSNNNGVCIEKCCGDGEMFAPNGTCMNTVEVFKIFKNFRRLASDVNYRNIVLFSWDNNVKTKSEKHFVFIRNHRDAMCTVEEDITNEYFILEDGSIRMQDTSFSKLWFTLGKLEYCIDYKLQPVNHTLVVKLVVKEYISDNTYDDKKEAFLLVGLLVSSLFLVLVLVVYCLLPKLRNLIGLVLMSYTASILVTFLFKIVIKFTIKSLSQKSCKIISPMMYFSAVSSFFWLNVMSYDVWWSLRGHRKRCDINRRGERVKYMWYCLYAWGAPLVMTAVITVLDNTDLSAWNIVKIPFDDCFAYEKGVTYYLNIPLGIIIFVNIILFLLTVYNIWMIKRAVHRCEDSRRSQQDTNRFTTYLKLSVVMGVSWILELIPSTTSLCVFILTTTYNMLVGVAIFFLFVFNKQILMQLCKRFNIKNKFTRKWGTSQESRSGFSRPTGTSPVKDQSHELELLKDRLNGNSNVDA